MVCAPYDMIGMIQRSGHLLEILAIEFLSNAKIGRSLAPDFDLSACRLSAIFLSSRHVFLSLRSLLMITLQAQKTLQQKHTCFIVQGA